MPKAYAKKETSPLSRFARNSLPHKKASRFFVPQCSSGPIWTRFDLARKLAYQIKLLLLLAERLLFAYHIFRCSLRSSSKSVKCQKPTQKKKLPLFLASLEIHCLTKKLRAFLFPNALVVPFGLDLI